MTTLDSPPLSPQKYEPRRAFWDCYELLRNKHGIIGDKALRIITQLIVFKYIEPNIRSIYRKHSPQRELLFSDFVKLEDDADKRNRFIKLLEKVFGQNPNTKVQSEINAAKALKNIFRDKDIKNIEDESTIAKLVAIIDRLPPTTDCNYAGVLGGAYEDLLSRQLQGKFLGQFVTPAFVRETVIAKIIKPKPGESIFDVTCGTAGFLVSAIKYVKTTNPEYADAARFAAENYGGNEIDVDAFKFAQANLLTHTGTIFPNVRRLNSFEDSYNQPQTYDIILSNPPFGLKVQYNDIVNDETQQKFRNRDKMPLATRSAVFLFLQLAMSYLKLGGRCAIIVPHGKELFNRQQGACAIRRFLVKTCKLCAIMQLEQNTFDYTNIRACVLFFRKVYGKEDVENFATEDIPVIDTNLQILYTITHAQLIENDYILDFDHYLKAAKCAIARNTAAIEWVRIGDLFDIQRGDLLNKADFVDGPYPVFGGGEQMGWHNEHNAEEGTIICPKIGFSIGKVKLLEQKSWISSNCMQFVQKRQCNVTYVFLYLRANKQEIIKHQKGLVQPSISKTDLANLMIPYPPPEVQQQIVTRIQEIDDMNSRLSQAIRDIEKIAEHWRESSLFGSNHPQKLLSEICTVRHGAPLGKEQIVEGPYPVIGGGKPRGYHNEFNTPENTVLCSRDGVAAGGVSIFKQKTWVTEHCFMLVITCAEMSPEFLFAYLKFTEPQIKAMQKGLAQPHVCKQDLENIIVPVPPEETQKQITEQYMRVLDTNRENIKLMNEQIANNKQLIWQMFRF